MNLNERGKTKPRLRLNRVRRNYGCVFRRNFKRATEYTSFVEGSNR